MNSAHYDFSRGPSILCERFLKLPGEKESYSSDGQKLGMVMFTSPTKHPKLWNAEAKIHGQGSLICSSLLKQDMQPLCCTFWGLRPEISLSLHPAVKKSRKILVRSSCIRFRSCSRSCRPHVLRSWMGETWHPGEPLISAQARDEGKIVGNAGSDLVSTTLLSDLCFEDSSKDIPRAIERDTGSHGQLSRSDEPVEEPWLLESSVFSQCVGQTDASTGLRREDKISNGLDIEVPNSLFQDPDDLVTLNSKTFKRRIFERGYPVEEPWLCQPSHFFRGTDITNNEESIDNEAENVEQEDRHRQLLDILSLIEEGSSRNEEENQVAHDDPKELENLEPVDQHRQLIELLSHAKGASFRNETENQGAHDDLKELPEKLLLDEGSRAALQEEPVETVILINSSLCTMQRIAVLEDGKLVEILLEPVKNDVQADSVYLGVITKLLPHMGGAFVNIGSSKTCFTNINNYREPFIFPPFRQQRKQTANDSLLLELLEHPRDDEDEQKPEQVEIIDNIEEHEDINDPVEHDDFGEHEMDNGFDVSDELSENVNGSFLASALEVDAERHLHQPIGSSHNSLPETMTGLIAGMKSSRDAQDLHVQDMGSSKGSPNNWAQVKKGTKIIVQVVKEGLGTKSPTVTPYPKLRSRFWVLMTCCDTIGISNKIPGLERIRLRALAKKLQPPGFGLTVRTVAAGHALEELQKDLDGLLSAWKGIIKQAQSAALAADEGMEDAVPVILHKALGQTLSVVQDYFNDKVKRMVVDSPRTYHEVTNYLQEIAPDLCDRVELYTKKNPLFDEYNIEEELNNMLSKRVQLSNGGYLVIEQTEALVSIDVNGGQCMLGHKTSQQKAVLDVNLAAAKQIAREFRLRDIGGLIVVDFIDMEDDLNKKLVYEEVKRAVERDRSPVKVSELSRHGLMEITRKRVRPSVTFKISEPCPCCNATGRVEALETSFSKIERDICRLLASLKPRPDPGNPKSWPRFMLRVDQNMCDYLTSGKRTRLAILSSSLKVWILLKVARGFRRGAFELKPLTDGTDSKNRGEADLTAPLLKLLEAGSTPNRKVNIFPIKKWKTGGKRT